MIMWQDLDPYNMHFPKTHTMNPERLERLKAILSIPSTYRQEKLVTEYVVEFCKKHGFEYFVDKLGSVLITKGKLQEGEFYGCFSAHMDTVHHMNPKQIVEKDNILTAWHDGRQVGIGGDDLAGCAAALTELLILPVVKVALFVGEEVGCVGSRNVASDHPDWFNDVGYMIEFDGPEDYMITAVCSGISLFDPEGEFITKSLPLLQESMGEKMRMFAHPYTDVSVIKKYFSFSCLNISIGYFNWHSSKEFVVISEVEKGIILGEKLAQTLGNKRYEYVDKSHIYNASNKYTNLWG